VSLVQTDLESWLGFMLQCLQACKKSYSIGENIVKLLSTAILIVPATSPFSSFVSMMMDTSPSGTQQPGLGNASDVSSLRQWVPEKDVWDR
jgi:hypothetical protein